MEVSKEGSNWADLPKNIIDLIAQKQVPPLSQFIRFVAVCKPWHAAIMENRRLYCDILRRCRHQVPLLMIPTKDKSRGRRRLYNIIDRKTYDLELPVPYNVRCCGSSHGWIATLSYRSFAVKLINPFTGGIINLPSINTVFVNGAIKVSNKDVIVRKIILSDDPYVNPDGFLVLAFCWLLSSIAIIRSGEKAWTYSTGTRMYDLKEAIFHKGKFYAIDERHEIVSIDVGNTDHGGLGLALAEKMVSPAKGFPITVYTLESYNVESSGGGILIVQRFCTHKDSVRGLVTVDFKVFKVEGDVDDGEARRVEVNNIGGDALFVGDNYSMSVDAARFPGCHPNSIYFTPVTRGCGSHDNGVFLIETCRFDRFYEQEPARLDIPTAFPFFISPYPSGLLQ